jgi:hypothetical protein
MARLNMDSKELMICEGNGEHLRYAADHQSRNGAFTPIKPIDNGMAAKLVGPGLMT